MGLFKKTEKQLPVSALVGEAPDYDFYDMSAKEKVLWFFIGMVVSGAILYVFYESLFASVIFGVICGFIFLPIRKGQIIKKRKKTLTLQFRGLLDALSTSIGAGKNVYDSFASASDDLAVQFSQDADIVNEVIEIRSGLNNNIQIEALLTNFAERSHIEDIKNFADVFATCYNKGGNIKEVIKKTAKMISDKIEIEMELDTMVAGQKNEQNIMLVMPVIFVIIMKSMGGGLVDLKSPAGILSVSIAIVIFIAAYFVSKKILNIKI